MDKVKLAKQIYRLDRDLGCWCGCSETEFVENAVKASVDTLEKAVKARKQELRRRCN